jgi:hypothetical protein
MSNEVSEVAKAAAETAKFGTKALDVTEKLLSFFGKVFHEPIEQASGIVSDKLKFVRWQRQVRMADEVNKILESRGTTQTRAVPPKLALPILEAASNEDNDELQDMWAKLLANAMDPGVDVEIRLTFVEILKALNPLDVKLLHEFYKALKNDPKVDWSQIHNFSLTKEQIVSGLGMPEQEYYISVYNLFRVQCMTPAILKGGISIGKEPLTAYKGVDQIAMTHLGVRLVELAIK